MHVFFIFIFLFFIAHSSQWNKHTDQLPIAFVFPMERNPRKNTCLIVFWLSRALL